METIRVKKDNSAGYATINKSDFDEKKHVLFVEEEPKKPESKAAKKTK